MDARLDNAGGWIKVNDIDCYILQSLAADRLMVAFLQGFSRSDAIKDVVVWRNEKWEFEYDSPSGYHMHSDWVKFLRRGPGIAGMPSLSEESPPSRIYP